jgi:hypothetical protein
MSAGVVFSFFAALLPLGLAETVLMVSFMLFVGMLFVFLESMRPPGCCE